MMAKFCKDCRHLQFDNSVAGSRLYLCKRPVLDLVTGEACRCGTDARTERMYRFTNNGHPDSTVERCGPDAKFFEAKTA